MAQLLAPDADVETVGWASTPLFSKINKAYPGTGVGRIQSSVDPVNVDFEVSLAPGTDPVTHKGHRLKYRLRNSVAGETNWTIELKQGAAVIATGAVTGLATTTDTWFSLRVSEAEAANITDYTALSARFSVNKVSGTSIRGQMDACYLEIPDVNSCATALPGGIAASKVRVWFHCPAMTHANLSTPANLQDESGNGNSLVVGVGMGAGTFKTNLVNGLSGVEFDGVNDQYRMFFDEATERITYFHILRHLTVPAQINDDYVITTGEAGNAVKVMLGVTWAVPAVSFTGPHYLIEQEGASNHQYMGDNLPQTSTFVVLRTRFDAGPTGDRFWSDGVEITDGTTPGDAGANPTIGCKVGSREDETFWWNGQIVSHLICQGLTDQEEAAVEADLIALLTAGNGGGGIVIPDRNRMGGTGAIRRSPNWLSQR